MIFEALGHSNKFFIVIYTGLSGCDTENSLKWMRQETIYAANATYQKEDTCSFGQKRSRGMVKSGQIWGLLKLESIDFAVRLDVGCEGKKNESRITQKL